MDAGIAHNGSVDIAYERFGADGDDPLLLVMGLGMQMISWPDEFCAALADRGFAVARFDNRDVGQSTHFTARGAPSVARILARPRDAAPYLLDDMAADGVAVLDALGWPSAHVVGVSLGGMIAQTMAIRHPRRVRSLTSTPSPRIGRPASAPRGARRAAGAQPRSRAADGQGLPGHRLTGIPHDEAWLRDIGRRAFERGQDPLGARRQLAAILASGDRRAGLAGVRVPTLVMHGDADPLVRPSGGRATAAAVPGARLVVYPGLGHDLPAALWRPFIDQISATARTAAR